MSILNVHFQIVQVVNALHGQYCEKKSNLKMYTNRLPMYFTENNVTTQGKFL